MTNYPSPAVWFPAIRANSGADVFTERLCSALNKQGIRAEITWLPLRAEYAPWSVPAPTPPDWATVVHINTWLPLRFIPKNLPVVATMHHCVHDPDFTPFKKISQRIYHALWIKKVEFNSLRRAQYITAISNYTAEKTKQCFPIRNIETIYNGIDLSGPFQPPILRKPHKPFRLLYTGNWIARKGVDLIGPIMEELGPDFELHFTADRNGRHLKAELPENCYCLGRLPSAKQVSQVYQNADVLLFPSRLEGFGLTVLEAMACGLPVIASRTSALPEVVADGITGILCPAEDTSSFIQAARKLKDNFQLWQSMCKSARTHVEKLFSIEKQLHAYIDIYRRAADIFTL